MRVIELSREQGVRTARRAAEACCCEAVAGPVCADSVQLLTSELVTNALRHGSGRVTFGLVCGPDVVRGEVADEERAVPHVTAAADDDESGRGILIVDALASCWGVQPTAGGKVVWFEVDTRP